MVKEELVANKDGVNPWGRTVCTHCCGRDYHRVLGPAAVNWWINDIRIHTRDDEDG